MVLDSEEQKFVDSLLSKKILVSGNEDDDFCEELKISHNIRSYSCNRLGLTLAPTIECNLSCPYCFEGQKTKGYMTDKVISEFVKFVADHKTVTKYDITWFGGEPLLALPQIQKILNGLSQIEEKSMTFHSIITNGTLLNSRAIEVFKDFPLDSIQVTLDGTQASHDKKRFYSSGCGTFASIIDNVETFATAFPKTSFSFRINVDNSNKHEYTELYRFLKKELKGIKMGVYPGILRAVPGCSSTAFITRQENFELVRSLNQNNCDLPIYPTHASKGCCATNVSSHVVGPQGELYRCWEHVGKKNLVSGSIFADKSPVTSNIFNRFILHGSCFDDPKCMKCGFLPVCSGGCPNQRLNLNSLGGADKSLLCTLYYDDKNQNLADFLYDFYLSQNRK